MVLTSRLLPGIALAALAVLASACQRNGPEARLLREFEGSYPAEARAGGQVRTFELVAEEQEVPLIDGTRMRVWAYNGQVPGPTLRVRLGDTVRVHFTNKLPQPTTIHWHGVRVPNNMDGVPNATQPPIAPGSSFTYEFTPKDAGTFWFHPHIRSSEQVERGLYGVLVVEDAAPAPYSRDVVWVIDDWLLDDQHQVFGQFNTRHDLMHDGRWGNVTTVNGHREELLEVRPGERIRLRMVNTANGRVFAPDFSGLGAKVIAVDGLYLREPMDLGTFELAPGNRLDLDLSFPVGAGASYAIMDRFYARQPNLLARIRVDGQEMQTPAFASPAHGHVPAWTEGLSTPVTQEFRLNARQGGAYGIEWTINGRAFAGHEHAMPSDFTLKRNGWAHLRFVNESYRLHPIHLHGMFFRLLARNGQPVDEPFFRDTVLIHAKETVDLGLVPLDEGHWMMHCHILEHAEAGMMTMIDVTSG